MKTFKKIMRGVLLYSTLLIFFGFLISAESLFEVNRPVFALIFIGLVNLIILCFVVFQKDDLNQYVPKWFRDGNRKD